jgi:nickel-dependent lactate racemase
MSEFFKFMSQISLPYGKAELKFESPAFDRKLDLPLLKVQVSPEKFASDLAPFLDDIPKKSTIAIVVADKTRLCGYDCYLPVLLDEIIRRKVDQNRITIYIAYGTHPPQSEEESREAYGKAWSQFRFIHHDCRDRTLFRELGTTKQGTPLRTRKDICDVDFLITFGAVSHHYFAGYGGGRKLIFPGLGEQKAIYHNHFLFLDRKKKRLADGCGPGRLSNNPLAEDLAEVEKIRPTDLAIHGILNYQGKLCRLLVGRGDAFFQTACKIHAAHSEIDDSVRYDLVLASCGGFPKDINFIQSHKAIHNAAMFVKDGGTLVVLAECRDGIGSDTFLPWFDLKDRKTAFDHLAKGYQGNGGAALAMMEKTCRIKIGLMTDLDKKICDKIGIQKLPYDTVAKMVKKQGVSPAVISNAGHLVKVSDSDKR